MELHLVRHGRPLRDPTRPAREWSLDPAGLPAIEALRGSGLLPPAAAWFSSSEPKALGTARLLTDGPVTVVPALAEAGRADYLQSPDAFRQAVLRSFADQGRPAVAGWEPLTEVRARLLAALAAIMTAVGDDPVVLVGHGTAWTVLTAALTDTAPDPEGWSAMTMPDHRRLEPSDLGTQGR